MSMTSLLKDKEVKAKFKSLFKKPSLSYAKVPIAVNKNINYSLVGTAFDYCVRFYLSHLYKDLCVSRPWVAYGVLGFIIDKRSYLYKVCADILKKAEKTFNSVLAKGVFTYVDCLNVLRLARLEMIVRSGGVFPCDSIDYVNDDTIKDLVALCSNIYKFLVKEKCFLNPSFKLNIDGGADADLIIDDMLIDIKTTVKHDFTLDYFMQLVGYYMLSLEDFEEYKINKLGVYFSRQNHLLVFNASDIEGIESIEEFKLWLIDFVSTRDWHKNGGD